MSRPYCETCNKFKPLQDAYGLGTYGICMDVDADWKNKQEESGTWSNNRCLFDDYDNHYVEKGGDKE